jgi:hypothetical protein
MLSNSETIFDSDSENIDLKVGVEVVVELEGGYIIAVFGYIISRYQSSTASPNAVGDHVFWQSAQKARFFFS